VAAKVEFEFLPGNLSTILASGVVGVIDQASATIGARARTGSPSPDYPGTIYVSSTRGQDGRYVGVVGSTHPLAGVYEYGGRWTPAQPQLRWAIGAGAVM